MPGENEQNISFSIRLGKGVGCVYSEKQHLEQGYLPVVHGILDDEGINYNYTTYSLNL